MVVVVVTVVSKVSTAPASEISAPVVKKTTLPPNALPEEKALATTVDKKNLDIATVKTLKVRVVVVVVVVVVGLVVVAWVREWIVLEARKRSWLNDALNCFLPPPSPPPPPLITTTTTTTTPPPLSGGDQEHHGFAEEECPKGE